MSDSGPYMPQARSMEWETPWPLFEALDIEFNFTIDAAATSKNTKCERYWTKETDGLTQDWSGETLFINPPFRAADLRRWVEKAWLASREPETIVVMIVPVKSDQFWWGDFAIKTEIRFIKGRVTFEGAKNTMPGPVAVLVFGKYITRKNVSMRRPKEEK